MSRQTLIVQTICFHESDRGDAEELGEQLYGLLTRPVDDALAAGPGIPVYSAVSPDEVDLEAAEHVVLVPVLGKTSYFEARASTVKQLSDWHEASGARPGRLLVVPTASNWRDSEDVLPGLLLTELSGAGERRRHTLERIVFALARLFLGAEGTEVAEGDKVKLFVSHAKADLKSTGDAAPKIVRYVTNHLAAAAFLDARDLHPGHSQEAQIEQGIERGIFVQVRSDAYSSRSWCVRELLRAKRLGLPTLAVEVLTRGEERSTAYAGNGPSLVWRDNPQDVVSRALVEWLRHRVFDAEARRIWHAAGLPEEPTVLCRPPELLDLAQGPLAPRASQFIMHPDPELPTLEKELLLASNPRLHLVTPTTVYRRVLEPRSWTKASPLDGREIALSLSETESVNGPEGYTERHVRDATVFVARSLIAAGARIAYGGDFRWSSYTGLLASLIGAYNQTAGGEAKRLHSFLGIPVKYDDAPADQPIEATHLGSNARELGTAWGNEADEAAVPTPLFFSDMRRVMAERTDARVVLVGQTRARAGPDQPGYGGRYPGVVEEAWRTLGPEEAQPLYVIGGFGGAAALVADLLEGGETPAALQEKELTKNALYARTAAQIDATPWPAALKLPRTPDDLADELRERGKALLASDQTARAWNGLTVGQNHDLFRTRDPVLIASLILEGLTRRFLDAPPAGRTRGGTLGSGTLGNGAPGSGAPGNGAPGNGAPGNGAPGNGAPGVTTASEALNVELVRGGIVSARDLELLAVPVYDGVPLAGEARALDVELEGKVRRGRAAGDALIDVSAGSLGAEWLHLVPLGAKRDDGAAIEAAGAKLAALVRRHGFTRVGVVTFGGAPTQEVVRAMLRGLAPLARGEERAAVAWFEAQEERFDALHTEMKSAGVMHLTTRVSPAEPRPPSPRDAELVVIALRRQDALLVTASQPGATGLAPFREVRLEEARLAELSRGVGDENRETPTASMLEQRGTELAELLFGAEAPGFLAHNREARLVVVHDVNASRLPFELLLPRDAGDAGPATLAAGLTRRLAVDGVPLDRLFARPPHGGKLRVLLIANPTEDLPGAEREAEVVLEQLQQHAKVTYLHGTAAIKATVLKELSLADVLHYSGHAFFDGTGDHESGLRLAAGESLTLADLAGRELSVRLAFVNACESARVRAAGKDVVTAAAAFAELFLRSGIEAYLGTYWRVGDAPAGTFAAQVYAELAAGADLDHAVHEARLELWRNGDQDWANYLLYGDGRFRLVQPGRSTR